EGSQRRRVVPGEGGGEEDGDEERPAVERDGRQTTDARGRAIDYGLLVVRGRWSVVGGPLAGEGERGGGERRRPHGHVDPPGGGRQQGVAEQAEEEGGGEDAEPKRRSSAHRRQPAAGMRPKRRSRRPNSPIAASRSAPSKSGQSLGAKTSSA